MPETSTATPIFSRGLTDVETFNNLILRIPTNSVIYGRRTAELSAIQELIALNERRMRGEGLPPATATRVEQTYESIIDAIVADRISTDYGSELLGLHGQLVDLAFDWDSGKYDDEPHFEGALNDAFLTVRAELKLNATPHDEIPYSVRTPLVNGFQAWLLGFQTWSCDCRGITRSERYRIKLRAQRLEKFERVYKANGSLTAVERRLLHEKLIELQREVIDILL